MNVYGYNTGNVYGFNTGTIQRKYSGIILGMYTDTIRIRYRKRVRVLINTYYNSSRITRLFIETELYMSVYIQQHVFLICVKFTEKLNNEMF